MGEMGREFAGGHAEYALLPNELLIPVSTSLPWDVFAALPETYLIAYGSLAGMGVEGTGRTLSIRTGTSSVGMATLFLAKALGLETIATTRNSDKAASPRTAAATHVVIDGGDIAAEVRKIRPEGPDYVLDLLGAPTMAGSLQLAARGGTVCMTGVLSGVSDGAGVPAGDHDPVRHQADRVPQ